jgi:hypothetical protein
VFDVQGDYVKTFCDVRKHLSRFDAMKNCEYQSMKLASPTEYVSELSSFTSRLYPNGGWIWIDGKIGTNCTILRAPLGSSLAFSVAYPFYCYERIYSTCEYNSEFELLLFNESFEKCKIYCL